MFSTYPKNLLKEFDKIYVLLESVLALTKICGKCYLKPRKAKN